VSLTDQGRQALAMRALNDVSGQPPHIPVTRYLDSMDSSKELLPGARKIVEDKVLGKVGNGPATRGGTAVERLTRAIEFLESEQGQKLRNPEFKADDLPSLKRHLARLGVPRELAEKIYTEKAAEFAGRTSAGLVQGIYVALAQIESGKHLGYQPRVMTKPEGYTPSRPAGVPTITESHYRRIKSSF
jgi:hypothetical protein